MDRNTRAFVFVLAVLAIVAFLTIYFSLPSDSAPVSERAEGGSPESAPTQVSDAPRESLLPEDEPIDTMTRDLEFEESEAASPPQHRALLSDDADKPESKEGGTIEGVVTLDGKPYPNVSIDVLDAELNVLMQGYSTDSDGQYEIQNVPAGEHKVRAIVGDRRISMVAIVADGMTTVVNLPFDGETAKFSGRVIINGEPPSSFLVRGWVYTAGGEEQFKVQGDEDGVYRSEGFLPAGEAKLVVSAHGKDGQYYRRETMIQLEAGIETITDIEFSVAGGAHGVLTGFLPGGEGGVSFFPPGTPLPKTKAEFTVEAFSYVMDSVVSFAYANSSGEFKAVGLEPGEYDYAAFTKMSGNEAAAYRDGHYAFGTVTIKADQSVELNLQLKPLPDE